MADQNLNEPVIVRAVSLNASSIPAGYSPAYSQYILSQAIDFTNVAGKANEAGQGAYDAQVKNDEQDVTLADHDSRITANTNAINILEVRITTAEGKIVVLRSDVDYLLDEVIDIQADIVNIQADYISKSATSPQSLSSSLGVSTSYSVNGVKVIGQRISGFTAITGTPFYGAFDANYSETGSSTYNSAQITTLFALLQQTRQRVKALDDALRTHGQIS
ncbi:hypothetical protein [Kluyvera genomosp. 1]|uniref:hypothetical protein n=1 Tax=Kluyvera genomosp. 1 TaxID=2774053 RepID=UPI0006917EA1|nr:hypothetical protein [Kluyvera genomosp. 1]